MVEVKVIEMPGFVQTVGVPDGSTIRDAIVAANLSTSADVRVQRNHEKDVPQTEQVADGDRIVIAKAAKGN
jgi:putative ubiquitin-RnfH superfamily antitoxin RatB of RatAB toxin-antitoxin module